MKETYEFSTKNLYMRTITADDTDQIVTWRSDPKIIQYFCNPTPLTKENHLNWFRNRYLQDRTRLDFMIFFHDTPIGFLTVAELNIEYKSAIIGYAIGDLNWQGKGYGKESVRGLMDFLQRKFDVIQCRADIHIDNNASVGMIESLEFQKEGIDGTFLIYKNIK